MFNNMVGLLEGDSLPTHNAIKQSNVCSVWYHKLIFAVLTFGGFHLAHKNIDNNNNYNNNNNVCIVWYHKLVFTVSIISQLAMWSLAVVFPIVMYCHHVEGYCLDPFM